MCYGIAYLYQLQLSPMIPWTLWSSLEINSSSPLHPLLPPGPTIIVHYSAEVLGSSLALSSSAPSLQGTDSDCCLPWQRESQGPDCCYRADWEMINPDGRGLWSRISDSGRIWTRGDHQSFLLYAVSETNHWCLPSVCRQWQNTEGVLKLPVMS